MLTPKLDNQDSTKRKKEERKQSMRENYMNYTYEPR